MINLKSAFQDIDKNCYSNGQQYPIWPPIILCIIKQTNEKAKNLLGSLNQIRPSGRRLLLITAEIPHSQECNHRISHTKYRVTQAFMEVRIV